MVLLATCTHIHTHVRTHAHTRLQLLYLRIGPVQLDLAVALVQAVHERWLCNRVHSESIFELGAVFTLRVCVLL